MCGRIWTPPDCNTLIGPGLAITIADVYPASMCGPIHRRREPRWISARLSLNGSKTSAFAVPVHTSGSRSDGSDPFTISCQFAAMFRSELSSFFFRCRVSQPMLSERDDSLLRAPKRTRRSWHSCWPTQPPPRSSAAARASAQATGFAGPVYRQPCQEQRVHRESSACADIGRRVC